MIKKVYVEIITDDDVLWTFASDDLDPAKPVDFSWEIDREKIYSHSSYEPAFLPMTYTFKLAGGLKTATMTRKEIQ